jgi:hypothetical protein
MERLGTVDGTALEFVADQLGKFTDGSLAHFAHAVTTHASTFHKDDTQ